MDLDSNLGGKGPFEIPTPGTSIDDLPSVWKPDFNPSDQNGYTIGAPAGSAIHPVVANQQSVSHYLINTQYPNISIPAGTPFAGGLGFPPVMWEGDGGKLITSFAALVAANQAIGIGGADAIRIRLASFNIIDTAVAPAGQLVLQSAVLILVGSKNTFSRQLDVGGGGRAGFNWWAQLTADWNLRGLDLDPQGPANALLSVALELSFASLDNAAVHVVTVQPTIAIDVFRNVVTS
jgi:hypothetical protein